MIPLFRGTADFRGSEKSAEKIIKKKNFPSMFGEKKFFFFKFTKFCNSGKSAVKSNLNDFFNHSISFIFIQEGYIPKILRGLFPKKGLFTRACKNTVVSLYIFRPANLRIFSVVLQIFIKNCQNYANYGLPVITTEILSPVSS